MLAACGEGAGAETASERAVRRREALRGTVKRYVLAVACGEVGTALCGRGAEMLTARRAGE